MVGTPEVGQDRLLTTRRWGLSRSELATTALAVAASTTAYLVAGTPYLARGVVGDLVGFGVLGVLGALAGARVKHEALVCLTMIGLVLACAPQWPLRFPEGFWWAVFFPAFAIYVALRWRLCRAGRAAR